MGKVLIVVCTIIVLLSIIVSNNKKNKRLIKSIYKTLKEINKTYKAIFTEGTIFIKIMHGGIFVVSEILVILMVVSSITNYVLTQQTLIHYVFAGICILVALLILHLSIGYILLITTGIQKFIGNVKDEDLKGNLLLSYFLLSVYFTVFLFDPKQFEGIHIIALAGLLISYILNLKVLIRLIKNPVHIKSKHGDNNTASRITIISVLLLIMVILNLFLATCLINQIYPGSFSNVSNNFDLFYYTIITFTTVGYGDIIPVTVPAKLIGIIISTTSVICITIFLSSVLSYKES
ncbi:two pore domain potassium channel family protein [Romboutsia weinsteinii]|uniref:Two pore domain potassium channel family protein n=1 Tax=Romboutsia weinsteinii TaxID=2020949 RepID=A0A371J2J2_9FIRM|nr:potassium channel family protein [Romboutsia weinsteinii]RDY26876.1 two pore domain potassium channel family protein [Romboutsia weinsteinii]